MAAGKFQLTPAAAMPVGIPNQVHGALPHPSPLEDLPHILRDIDFHQRAPAQRRSPQEKGALWGHIFRSSPKPSDGGGTSDSPRLMDRGSSNGAPDCHLTQMAPAFAHCASQTSKAVALPLRIIPFPSRMTTNWLAATFAIVSVAPLVQRIVRSAEVSAPSPKCKRRSLAE
jgi:hypothetical protein